MVQDGEGRKMSKSLGNGVDPLDIIASHGADAMRFTLAHMTTQTQDVRMPVERDPKSGKNTSPKFDLGRNFCNKLWNAVRFALSNLENVPHEPVNEKRWSVVDRWIVSRAARTIKEVNEALAEYRFDAYARSCYDFFWRDLCDWYIEAIKPAMRDPARAPQTAAVLALCIDLSLRLMHPMIPFITEALWWKLNEVRPERGIAGKIELKTGTYLIRAGFPRFDEQMDTLTSSGAEFVMTKLQELIGAIRTLRNDHKVDLKRTITVSIRTPENSGQQIMMNREMIESLAMCRLAEVGADIAAPQNAAKASASGCEIFAQDLVDEAAEQQRNAKKREELTREIATLKARLANKGYVERAPAALVKQTQDRLAAAEAELAVLA
jgi:valyl-tRNA synthetase